MGKLILLGFLIFLFFDGCQPKIAVQTSSPPVNIPEKATIHASSENVRQAPNGKIIGSLKKGNQIRIKKRLANWLLFTDQKFDSAYVWAPSAGFDYINLYNPLTYFDSTAGDFHSLDYLQSFLGSEGNEQPVTSTHSEIFFSNIGLGSHEDIVVEVVNHQREEVLHGITLSLHPITRKIRQVKIDFFRPVKGVSDALRKCGLANIPPSATGPRRISWAADTLVPDLTLDLERQEWESEWFSGLRLTTSD